MMHARCFEAADTMHLAQIEMITNFRKRRKIRGKMTEIWVNQQKTVWY